MQNPVKTSLQKERIDGGVAAALLDSADASRIYLDRHPHSRSLTITFDTTRQVYKTLEIL